MLTTFELILMATASSQLPNNVQDFINSVNTNVNPMLTYAAPSLTPAPKQKGFGMNAQLNKPLEYSFDGNASLNV